MHAEGLMRRAGCNSLAGVKNTACESVCSVCVHTHIGTQSNKTSVTMCEQSENLRE